MTPDDDVISRAGLMDFLAKRQQEIQRDALTHFSDASWVGGAGVEIHELDKMLELVREFPAAAPVVTRPHYFVQEADAPAATCVHCGDTDDGNELPNCPGAPVTQLTREIQETIDNLDTAMNYELRTYSHLSTADSHQKSFCEGRFVGFFDASLAIRALLLAQGETT